MSHLVASKFKITLEPQVFLLQRGKKDKKDKSGLPSGLAEGSSDPANNRVNRVGNSQPKKGVTIQFQTAEPAAPPPSNSLIKVSNVGEIEADKYMLYQEKQYVKGELRKKGELTWVPQFKKTVRVIKNRGEETTINIASKLKRVAGQINPKKGWGQLTLPSILKKGITRGSSTYSFDETGAKLVADRPPSIDAEGQSGSGDSSRAKQKNGSPENSRNKLSSRGTNQDLFRVQSGDSRNSFSFQRIGSQKANASSKSRFISSFQRTSRRRITKSKESSSQLLNSPTRTEGRMTATFLQSPQNMSPLNLEDVTKITEQLEELETPGLAKRSRSKKAPQNSKFKLQQEKQLQQEDFSSVSSEERQIGTKRPWIQVSDKRQFDSERSLSIKLFHDLLSGNPKDQKPSQQPAAKSYIDLPNHKSAKKPQKAEGKFSIALKAVSDKSRNSFLQEQPETPLNFGIPIKSTHSPAFSSRSQRHISNQSSVTKGVLTRQVSAGLRGSDSSSGGSAPNSLKGMIGLKIEMLSPINKPRTPKLLQPTQPANEKVQSGKLLSPTSGYLKKPADLKSGHFSNTVEASRNQSVASYDKLSENSSKVSQSYLAPKKAEVKRSAFSKFTKTQIEPQAEPEMEKEPLPTSMRRPLIPRKSRQMIVRPGLKQRLQRAGGSEMSSQFDSHAEDSQNIEDRRYRMPDADAQIAAQKDPLAVIRALAEKDRKQKSAVDRVFGRLPEPGYKLAAGVKQAVQPNDSESSNDSPRDDPPKNWDFLRSETRRKDFALKKGPPSFLVDSQPFMLLKLALSNMPKLEATLNSGRRAPRRRNAIANPKPKEDWSQLSAAEQTQRVRRRFVEASRPPHLVDPMQAYLTDVRNAAAETSQTGRLLTDRFFLVRPQARQLG